MFFKLFFLHFKLETAFLSCHHHPAPSGKKCRSFCHRWHAASAESWCERVSMAPGFVPATLLSARYLQVRAKQLFSLFFSPSMRRMTVCTWCVESLNSVFLTPPSKWLTFFHFKFLSYDKCLLPYFPNYLFLGLYLTPSLFGQTKPMNRGSWGREGSPGLGTENCIPFLEAENELYDLGQLFNFSGTCFLICKWVWPGWQRSPVAWMPGFWGWHSQPLWTPVFWKTEGQILSAGDCGDRDTRPSTCARFPCAQCPAPYAFGKWAKASCTISHQEWKKGTRDVDLVPDTLPPDVLLWSHWLFGYKTTNYNSGFLNSLNQCFFVSDFSTLWSRSFITTSKYL